MLNDQDIYVKGHPDPKAHNEPVLAVKGNRSILIGLGLVMATLGVLVACEEQQTSVPKSYHHLSTQAKQELPVEQELTIEWEEAIDCSVEDCGEVGDFLDELERVE